MIKHSYIILPAPETGGRQTIVSLSIHGNAPSPQETIRASLKTPAKRHGGRKAS